VDHAVHMGGAMRSLIAVIVAVTTAAGCAETGDPQEIDDTDAKADGVSRPVGTFTLPMERTDDDAGGISLSLMTDLSFRREENLDPFVGPTIERGTYRYTKSGTKRFITLTFEDGRKDRQEYKLISTTSTLRLRDPGTTKWFDYEEDSEMCDTDEDCELQGVEGADCYYSGCITEFPEDP